MTVDGIKTIYWIVIGGMAGYFLLTGVLQGLFEFFNARRSGSPQEQKTAQDGIWNGVIAIAIILAAGGAVWAILSPQLTTWMSQVGFIGPMLWM